MIKDLKWKFLSSEPNFHQNLHKRFLVEWEAKAQKVLSLRQYFLRFCFSFNQGAFVFYKSLMYFHCNHLLENGVVLHLNKFWFPLPKSILCEVCLKLAWEILRRIWKCKCFSWQTVKHEQCSDQKGWLELSAHLSWKTPLLNVFST